MLLDGLKRQDSSPAAVAAAPDRVRIHGRRARWAAAGLLLFFSALIAADRTYVPAVPINVDPASYAVVAHEIINGQSLYTDIWDHKPPAVFIVYGIAEIVLGYSPGTLTILNLFITLVVLFGLYYAGSRGPGGMISGLWAAGLWVTVSGTFELEGRDPNTEPFMNACLIFAFALLVGGREKGLSRNRAFAIGLLFLIGSLFKPVVVAVAAILVLVYLLFARDRKLALINSVIIGGVGGGGWLMLFGYFAVTSRYEIFYQTIISYNGFYSGNLGENMIAPLEGAAELFFAFLNPLAIFAFLGVIVTFVHDRWRGLMLAAFVGSSWVAIALPGRFSVHYFQLWLPSLIVAASWGIGVLGSSLVRRKRLISYAAGAALMFILIFDQIAPYRSVFARTWSPVLPTLNSCEHTAAMINDLLEPDETFFAWGNTPNLYLLANRRTPTAVIFESHLRESPVFAVLKKRVLGDLDANKPELLVVELGRPEVPEWISEQYEREPIYTDPGHYLFFARRGGRLAHEQTEIAQSRVRGK